MRLFISADIEGVTGVVTWGQTGGPSGQHYDWPFARRMMTHDVNAAIRGAKSAGATHILIKDSHGSSKNLLIDELEPGIELISGVLPHYDGMVTGVDGGFDAAMLIGYHGRAGTLAGTMEHTISGGVHRMWINGFEAGEIGLSAATAGSHGVPLVMVSSDDKGCAEASELLPGLVTACVKQGMGRYMARLKHPSVTGRMIEEAAKRAIETASSRTPWTPKSPTTVRIEFNTTEAADAAALLSEWSRLDGFTVEQSSDDWLDLHRSVRRAISVAGYAGHANQ